MAIPALHRRSGLLADGHSADELRARLRDGELTRLRPGVYLPGPEPDDRDARHRLAVHAAFIDLADGAVASHGSAAVLHGLPTWGVPLERVQVTKVRAYGGRRQQRTHVRVCRLDPDEVTVVDGIPVTTIERTVVDLARSLPFEPAVALGDAALAAHLAAADGLVEALRRSAHRPGCIRARRVIAFLDGRSESVGESRSRVAIREAGLPAPVPQWEVRDARGRLLGRTDFGWPEWLVVGEFDGRIKYGRLLRPGLDAAEIVYREKLREDELRAEGLTVVRWNWADLAAFERKASRLRSALT
jgi:predicted transcriptional regulator of viral defense system